MSADIPQQMSLDTPYDDFHMTNAGLMTMKVLAILTYIYLVFDT